MPEVSLPVERPESSIQLWSNLADSLKHGGFGQAGPEYLKLAQIVTQVRRMQLVRSAGEARPDDAEWAKLSSIAGTVLTLLEPLREASRLLAELPTQLEARSLFGADATLETVATPAQLEPTTTVEPGETSTSEPPRSAARSRRSAAKPKPAVKRQGAARASKETGTSRATREPNRRARAVSA